MNQLRPILSAVLILLAAWIICSFGSIILLQPSSSTNSEMPATTVVTATSAAPLPSPAAAEGKQIFQQNCASCHNLDKAMTGPALRGFKERGPWADQKEVYKWVHNPGAYIPTNPYTKGLQQQYGAIMSAFPQLSEKQIDAITEYISTQPSATY